MSVLKWLGRKLKDLSPAAIREIIAVVVILCLSIVISLPQFFEDRKRAELQKKSLQTEENLDRLLKGESEDK